MLLFPCLHKVISIYVTTEGLGMSVPSAKSKLMQDLCNFLVDFEVRP
jgi:phage-related holin